MGKKSKYCTENNNCDKRKRAKNFCSSEIRLLMKFVMKHIEVIEDKTGDSNSWKAKNDTWNEIAKIFNVNSEVHRTVETLRLKYETIKKELKRKLIYNKKETFKTDGKAPNYLKLELYEDTLLNYISLPANGLPQDDDCGSVPPNTAINKEGIPKPGVVNFICVDDSSCSLLEVPDAIIINQENVSSECTTKLQSFVEPTAVISLAPQTSNSSKSGEFFKECGENTNKNLKRSRVSWTSDLLEEDYDDLIQERNTTTKQLTDSKLKECSESRQELIELQKESIRQEITYRQEDEKRRIEIHELQREKLMLENQLLKLEVLRKKKDNRLEYQVDDFI